MSTFFGHDFKEDRWRKAALKNAYALLGMQRFEHAVAFFLLAEALWDAVQVCSLDVFVPVPVSHVKFHRFLHV